MEVLQPLRGRRVQAVPKQPRARVRLAGTSSGKVFMPLLRILTVSHSATSTTLSTSSIVSTTSSAPTPGPTFLNNQSMPFAFQSFELPEYLGKASDVYKNAGTFDIAFNSTSYVWAPNGQYFYSCIHFYSCVLSSFCVISCEWRRHQILECCNG